LLFVCIISWFSADNAISLKIISKKVVKKFGQFQKRLYLCTALRNNAVSPSAIGV
jgi:hypothetical protein